MAANLSAAIFGGYADVFAISTTSGTTTDATTISSSQTVFIDAGFANFGSAATSGTFTALVKLDGITVHTITRNNGPHNHTNDAPESIKRRADHRHQCGDFV